MTLEETLAQIFPSSTLGYCNGAPRTSFEINGLTAGTVPAAGEILQQGHHKHTAKDERREQFLLKTASFLLFFRICSAGADSGYDEFATGLAYPAESPDADDFLAKSRESLQLLCA